MSFVAASGAGDCSIASVFDYTESTGYKWASSSSSETESLDLEGDGSDSSENAAVTAAFANFNIDDLKSGALVSKKNQNPVRKDNQELQFTPLHQSTPNALQMSGSTIRNDKDMDLNQTPSKNEIELQKKEHGLSFNEHAATAAAPAVLETNSPKYQRDSLKQTLDSLPTELQSNVLEYIHRIASNDRDGHKNDKFETPVFEQPIAESSPNDPPSTATNHNLSEGNVRFHFPQQKSSQQPTYPPPQLESVTDSGEPSAVHPQPELYQNKTNSRQFCQKSPRQNDEVIISRPQAYDATTAAEDGSERSSLNGMNESGTSYDHTASHELEKLKEYITSIENGDQLLSKFYANESINSLSISTQPQSESYHTSSTKSRVSSIGPESMPDYRRRVPESKKLYSRLEMTKVDELEENEAKNMIKNVLLLLGVPLTQLPSTMSAIVKALKKEDIYYQFATEVHQILYNEKIETRIQHKACLEQMSKIIGLLKKNTPPNKQKKRHSLK